MLVLQVIKSCIVYGLGMCRDVDCIVFVFRLFYEMMLNYKPSLYPNMAITVAIFSSLDV